MLWKLSSKFLHRAELFVNRDASDPQLYSPREYQPRYKQGLSPQFKPVPRDCLEPVKYPALTRPFRQLSLADKAKVLPGPGAYDPPGAFPPRTRKPPQARSARSLKPSVHSLQPSFAGLQRSSRALGTRR